MRQWGSRYAIRAGRNLPDKEFRYLRTVIVTAAVYRGFNSELSLLLLTFRHRAGVRPYTSSCDFAESYVFSKQSLPPALCNPRQLGTRSPSPPRAHLLPKLRCQFAEFLNQSSLKRLGMLCPPTCVGLRYGHQTNSLRGFSWKHGITDFASLAALDIASRRWMAARIYLRHPPTDLNRDVQHPARLPFSVPPSVERPSSGTGILTRFPSPTAFALGLGAD